MLDRRIYKATVSGVTLLGIAGLALAACNRDNQSSATSSAPPPLAALPLSTEAAPASVPAPVASALPPAPYAPVGRLADESERYAFADRADAMNSGFGDAQPDYTFDYGGGERPWVWRGDDRSARIAEPLPGGRDRYYYYEPGARTPYLVRDRDYSYGYANGSLVVIYDHQGRVLPPDYLDRQADLAGRLLSRAQAIRDASERQQRQAVAESSWVARHDQIDAERNQWAAQQQSEQDWRAYHTQHEQEYQAHWDAERYRREAEAARFAQGTNDPQQAEQDWQAARQAQARAGAAGQIQPAQNSNGGGLLGGAPRPIPIAPPPQQRTDNGLASSQSPHPDWRGPGALDLQGQPENRPLPPNPAVSAAAQSAEQRAIAAQAQAQAAARQAESQAVAARRRQMDAQRQAQLDAMARAKAEAARQADAQAAASRQAEAATQQRAQLLAETQARAQADASRKADAQASAARRAQAEEQQRLQLEAQTRAQAQAQAARQAGALAAATHQAQIVAEHRLQIQSQAAAQAQAAAARQAGLEAQGPAQAGLGIQREQAVQARLAEQARRKAQQEARQAAMAAAHPSDTNATGDPASATSDKAARRHHKGPASDQPDPGHP